MTVEVDLRSGTLVVGDHKIRYTGRAASGELNAGRSCLVGELVHVS
jgi:hypothetical protein